MFELLVISDELILKPGELGDFNKTIEDKIKNKYVNKIVSESAGLCVTLKSIVVRDKIVLPGEGSVQLRVDVSMVVFKPEVNEIISGKIVSQNEKGIFASVGVATVFIPAPQLQRPSYLQDLLPFDIKYSHIEKKNWFWNYQTPYELYYENGQIIKFKVSEVNFSKEYQRDIREQNGLLTESLVPNEVIVEEERQAKYILPHQIKGVCNELCLGMVSWY